ncbi:hypothetical protein Sjap_022112 [Stephania japonica]|uniref:DEAD/DEAH-box helicase domain-containing protein n=1 Tax=Stephania japonica TaxID=461633 RepID=A0AAP0HUQ7_9MAGN
MELKYKSQSSFAESKLLEKVLQSSCLLRFSLMLGRSCWTVETLSALQRLDQLGKTLVFGIPALVHVLCNKMLGDSGTACPWCSVLSPTRELAQQIADVQCEAGKSCGVKSICLFGGSSKGMICSMYNELGKTLAFGIPALVHVICKKMLADSGIACPWCSVLSPTRELPQQKMRLYCNHEEEAASISDKEMVDGDANTDDEEMVDGDANIDDEEMVDANIDDEDEEMVDANIDN